MAGRRACSRRWGCEVTGLTLSGAQLAYAAAPIRAPTPGWMQQDWLENDFPPKVSTAVLSIESSEHMVDKPLFFAEVARTLKPGGRFANCV